MNVINLFSKLTSTKRGKRKLACAVLIAVFVIVNLDQSLDSTKRYLTEEEQIIDDLQDEELNEGDGIPFVSRFLSKSLGGGKCLWTAPDALEKTETENTTTLLASYPGSGKR